MTLPLLEPLPFLEALAFWADKIQLGPKDFAALSDRAKALAFGVSRIAIGDELNTVYTLFQRALSDGLTLEEFRAESGDIFERRGWTGRNAWKVDSIFRTNIQSAYNAGKYQSLMRNLDIFPYWMYSAIDDDRVRQTHHAMDNRVWPADHPIWASWFPPNGFMCRCTVIGLTEEQVISRGLIVETDIPTGSLPIYDTDGNVTGNVPMAPDEGFAVNPGQVWLQTFGDYADRKLGTFADLLKQAALADLLTSQDMALLLSGQAGAENGL